MRHKEFAEANRIAWNTVNPLHQQSQFETLKQRFVSPGFNCLDERMTAFLNNLNLQNKKVAQLSCNNGREVLSAIHLGAAYGIGFDISDEAIRDALQLKQISGLKNTEFIRTDVYDIDTTVYKDFDLVFLTIGALAWLEDLDTLFSLINQMLKEKGYLYLYEMHPLIYTLGMEGDPGYDPKDPNKFMFSYFQDKILATNSSLDYYTGQQYDAPINYEFKHTLSDIINSIAENAFRIHSFQEYPDDIGNCNQAWSTSGLIPLSYSLSAQKVNK